MLSISGETLILPYHFIYNSFGSIRKDTKEVIINPPPSIEAPIPNKELECLYVLIYVCLGINFICTIFHREFWTFFLQYFFHLIFIKF